MSMTPERSKKTTQAWLARWVLLFLAGLTLSCQSETRISNPDAEQGQGICRVDRSSIAFDAVILGSAVLDTVELRNVGTGSLRADIRTTSPNFRVLSGGNRVVLPPGARQNVVIAFQPVEAGTLQAVLDFGNLCTRTLLVEGVALTPAECFLSESGVDFGEVPVGVTAERTITLQNRGDAALPLYTQPELLCDALTLSPFPLPEALEGGGSLELTLRFAPGEVGGAFCLVELSPDCAVDFTVQGQAVRPAECVVDPTEVSFGLVDLGDVRTADVTIRNSGDAPLSGTASLGAECDDGFSLSAGAGSFEVEGGATHTVSVQFSPTESGEADCVLNLGPDCPSVSISGTGDLAAVCDVSVSALEFGDIILGNEAQLSLDITNTGGSRLTGNVVPVVTGLDGVRSASCDDVAILLGGGFYELRAGQTHRVTVRWEPGEAGPIACGLDLGSACAQVPLTGEAFEPPECVVDVSELDFGTVFVGEFASRSVTLRNDGGSDLSGEIELAEDCQDFSIESGGGSYTLGPGASRMVTVRFTPTAIASHVCKLLTGSECASVTLTAFGDRVAECSLSASELTFGTVTLGAFLDRSFQVTNTGGSLLTGTVSLDGSEDYTLLAGAGAFQLAAGQSWDVTVRLTPATEGEKSAAISLGSGLCAPVSCTGAGEPPSECVVSTPEIDFGEVVISDSGNQMFTIRNDGGGTVTGSVALASCDTGFSIASGAGDFELGGGESMDVEVSFGPATAGSATCTVTLGSDCGEVMLQGTGLDPADCVVEVEGTGSAGAVDFGTVTLGDVRDTTIVVTNPGDVPLTGSVALGTGSSAYSLTGPTGPFELLPDMSFEVTVEFAPGTAGLHESDLTFGSELCTTITLSGAGEEPPACELSEEVIAFGTTPIDVPVERSFEITNAGGGVVSGSVPASTGCSYFAVLSGSGDFDLAAGETREVTVQFLPTSAGPAACDLDLGTACGTVSLSGTGDDPPACVLTPASLDFGTVPVGGSSTKSFTIRNDGGGVLHGAVGLFPCADYDIISGNGSFDLTAGASKTVTVEFAPTAAVTRTCTVSIGNTDCGDLEMVGEGEAAPECTVSLSTLNFGTVVADGSTSRDRSFTVENTGGGTLECNVSESCSYFTVVANGGFFTLGPGESRTVTVRYRPGSFAFGFHTCSINVASGCSVSGSGRGIAGFSAHVRTWVQDVLPDGRTCSSHHDWTYEAVLPETNPSSPVNSDIIQVPGNAAVAHTGGYFSYFDSGGTARTLILQWIDDGRVP